MIFIIAITVNTFLTLNLDQENDPERAPLLTFGDEDGAGVPNRSWTLLQALSPIDNKTWQDMTWYSTVYAIIKVRLCTRQDEITFDE